MPSILYSDEAYSWPPKTVPKPKRYTTPAPVASPVMAQTVASTGAFKFGDGSGFDANGNPVAAPAAPLTPATPATVPTPAFPADTSILSQEQFIANRNAGVDENAIRENTRKSMQASIDAINAQYANLVSEQERRNEDYSGRTRAATARSGTLGSDFGDTALKNQDTANKGAINALRDEQALMVSEVNTRVDEIARQEIAARKAEALGNAEAYSAYLEKAQTQARGDLDTLAKSGVGLDKLDPQRKAYLFKTAGYDPLIGELVYNAKKPKAEQIQYSLEKLANGKVLFYGQDPSTGKLVTQQYDYDIPADYELKVTEDGTPLLFNPATGEAKIAPGFNARQFAKPQAPSADSSEKQLSVAEALALGVPYGTTRGEAFGVTPTKPLTGEALNKRNALGIMEQQIAQAEALGNKTNYAGIGGLLQGTASQFLAKNFGKGKPEEQDLRNLIGNIKATLAKERGGTSFTANEQKLLETYTPTIDDSPLVIKSKLNTLKQFIQTSKEQISGTPGAATIRVREKASGQTGSIPANEFDPNLYEQL